ncbi:MAG: 16S rRNA (adenine(1518)-N(6)/adenine(1519)-N(6))-dimethyltransferase RsmA [Candidatus Vogelbacteria bacterium]|nr:16S rRNA (adenine(1518)-N(6)/adenine(1519)-N(6))-dimethyltransferase RsmA [Candidatus Vogelbacteria bacterium]
MFPTKKSLGQNWLTNPTIVAEILKAGEVRPLDRVLEIGPGEGTLTTALLGVGAKVIAVEKDDRLIDFLNDKFAKEIGSGQFTLIHGDILEVLPGDLGLKNGEYKLIANIPYYLTGQILRNFLESNCQPASMVLMVQKEVAERIVGSRTPNKLKESILSISVKAYGEPKYVRTVARGNFQPVPNVDSAVLLIDNISKDFFTHQKSGGQADLSENRFFEVVKKGFSAKRKMLKGNLSLSDETLAICDIPVKARAENLSLEQWRCLAKQMKNVK